MATREAPSGAPPAYARLPMRVYTSSLRPAVLMVAGFSAIYGLCAAAAVIRRRNESDTSSKMDTLYLAMAILYFVCAAIEIFGCFAAYRQSIAHVKLYFYGSASVAVIATAAELSRLVLHFTDKAAIQAACRTGEVADEAKDVLKSTDAEIADYCSDVWKHAVYWDVGLLIFSFFLSLFFASLVASYLHQLLNPQLLRTHVAVAGSSQYAYPLQPYPNVAPYPPAGGQQYYGGPAPPPGYAPGGLPVYSNEGGYEMPRDDKTPGPDPFADRNAPQLSAEEREQMQHDEEMRRRAMESTETVTLEPRRENEGRV